MSHSSMTFRLSRGSRSLTVASVLACVLCTAFIILVIATSSGYFFEQIGRLLDGKGFSGLSGVVEFLGIYAAPYIGYFLWFVIGVHTIIYLLRRQTLHRYLEILRVLLIIGFALYVLATLAVVAFSHWGRDLASGADLALFLAFACAFLVAAGLCARITQEYTEITKRSAETA